MTTFKVTAYNEYSINPDNCRMVIACEVTDETVTDALDQMEAYANGWNKEQMQENQIVKIITCNGYVRTV
jgi:hypothetical protein